MPIISSFPDFQLSLEATEFGFKSEFLMRITHLHKIAHTWVEFKSKIEPINSILRVLWLKTFRTIIFDHTVNHLQTTESTKSEYSINFDSVWFFFDLHSPAEI